MTGEYTLENLSTLAAMLGYRYETVVWSPQGFTVVLEDSTGEELNFTAGTTDKAVELACERLAMILGQARG
jgi:hypothetical protein